MDSSLSSDLHGSLRRVRKRRLLIQYLLEHQMQLIPSGLKDHLLQLMRY